MADQYEIGMTGDEWGWTLRSKSGHRKDSADGFASRGEALRAARLHRGDQTITVRNDDGSDAYDATLRGGGERVVLVAGKRVVGEVDPPLGPGEAEVSPYTISPAGEKGTTR